MSYEAWGEPDEPDYDHLIDAGWMTEEQATEVVDAIKALVAAPVYEGGDKVNGISVEFLMRLTLLQEAAGLDVPDLMAKEAADFFRSHPKQITVNGKPVEFSGPTMSWDRAVVIAGARGYPTVTYRYRDGHQTHGGELQRKHTVAVRDGMAFAVADTSGA